MASKNNVRADTGLNFMMRIRLFESAYHPKAERGCRFGDAEPARKRTENKVFRGSLFFWIR